MDKATEAKMNALHATLAESLTRAVQPRTVTVQGKGEDAEPYEETLEPSPAAMAVAAKFLKDNSIFSTPEQSSALDELQQKLDNRRKRPSKQDLKDALGQIGSELLQ